MESDNDKRAKESGVRDRRYSIRYPFAADAEMLELESGSRATGVTSDLPSEDVSCVRGAPSRSTPESAECSSTGNKKVKMLAVVRVVVPKVGMGVEFLDIDPDSNATLLAWIENLRKSH